MYLGGIHEALPSSIDRPNADGGTVVSVEALTELIETVRRDRGARGRRGEAGERDLHLS